MIDACATRPWCFTNEATPATEARLERLRSGDEANAPAHWPTEVMNGLVMAVRRQRFEFARVIQFDDALVALPIHIEAPRTTGFWTLLLTTAVEVNLTVYDAAYLQLARDKHLLLAALDRELQKAASCIRSVA